MRIPSAKVQLLLVALFACGESDGPSGPINEAPVVPELESVAFALLGSGKVAFQRLGPSGIGYVATYVIDATAARSWHIFDNTLAEGRRFLRMGAKSRSYVYTGILTTGWDVYLSKSDGTEEFTQLTKLQGEGVPTCDADAIEARVPSRTGGTPQLFLQSHGSQRD